MKSFNFDGQEDFDKHISLSIPRYSYLKNKVSELIQCLSKNGNHLDVGCSTGSLVQSLVEKGIDSIGIDTSSIIRNKNYLIKDDFLNHDFSCNYNVISSMFFLQFLNPCEREAGLVKIKRLLKKNGFLIVCEKIFLDNPLLNSVTESMYLQSKLKNFSEKEVLSKKISLAMCMYLKTKSELVAELSQIGSVDIFWQDYNFMACIVTKGAI